MSKKKFKKIRQEPIFQQIISQIREMIVDGSLKPGDRLPAERKFSEMMGVNRHTLREALKALEYMGVVQGKTGVGTIINYVGQDVLVDKISIATLFSPPQFLFELIEIRKIVEPGIAAIAAERATDEDLANLTESISQIESDLKTGKRSDAYIPFHLSLAKATRNTTIVKIMEPIMSMQLQYRERVRRVKGRRSESFKEHMRIYQAVIDRMPDEAETAMAQHISQIEKTLRNVANPLKTPDTKSEVNHKKERPDTKAESRHYSRRFHHSRPISS